MNINKPVLLYLALLLGVLGLSGCIDIRQELWIHSDGSGRMEMDLGISDEKFAALPEGAEALDYIDSSMEKYRLKLENSPYVTNLIAQQFQQEGRQHWTFEFDTSDFETFFELDQKIDDPFAIRVETLEQGDFRFTQRLIPGGEEWLEYYYDFYNFQPKPSELDAMLQGHSWIVVFHAPRILDTNGLADADFQAVTWETPLEEIYKLSESKELVAVYQNELSTLAKPWFPLALAGVVVLIVFVMGLLLAGGVAIFVWTKRKKEGIDL